MPSLQDLERRPQSPQNQRSLIKVRLVVLGLGLATVVFAQDWPQFRGSPSLTGVSTAKPPAKPRVLWTYTAGDAIESSAAIAAGVVYVGVGNGELVALDLASGKLKWKYKAADLIGESSPAIADGVVYIGDLDGVVHAVNAADGKPLWK